MKTRLFLDRGIGETRGVVERAGLPHRLLIERDGDIACQKLGAVQVGRLGRFEPALGASFLALEEGTDALLSGRPPAGEGAAMRVEVTAEARADKGARVRLIAPDEGPPRLLEPAPSLAGRLAAFAPGIAVEEGPDARAAADEAQDAGLAIEHPLPGGGRLWVEPTRALVAIDVDAGVGAARKRVNLAALTHAARLLRLKALGGLVAIDLAGDGRDGEALAKAARAAFAEEGREAAFGPVSRFGLLQVALPWTRRPLAQVLLDETGRPTALTAALSLLRALEREGRAWPGVRLLAMAPPETHAAIQPYLPRLADRLGARFEIRADPGQADFQVSAT